jgi:hypothetical protein
MYSVLVVWYGAARLPIVSDAALRLVIRVQLHSLIAQNRFFDSPLRIAALIPELRRRVRSYFSKLCCCANDRSCEIAGFCQLILRHTLPR